MENASTPTNGLRCVVCKHPLKGKQQKYCSGTCIGADRQSPKGAKAYELRKRHSSWGEIAEQLGFASAKVAVSAARRHAKYKKRTWPLKVAAQRTG